MKQSNKNSLESAFNFTMEDLEYNQRGELSTRQKSLRKDYYLLFFAIAFVLFMIGVYVLTIASYKNSSVSILLFLFLIVFLFKYGRKIVQQYGSIKCSHHGLRHGEFVVLNKIKKQQFERIEHPAWGAFPYQLQVESLIQITLSDEQFDALQDNNEYCFYCYQWQCDKYKHYEVLSAQVLN